MIYSSFIKRSNLGYYVKYMISAIEKIQNVEYIYISCWKYFIKNNYKTLE